LGKILDENKREVLARWLDAAREDTQIAEAGLSDRELADYMTALIDEIIERCGGGQFSDAAWKAASAHGRLRFRSQIPITKYQIPRSYYKRTSPSHNSSSLFFRSRFGTELDFY
jgi:RsbT co-antagonist protein rsbRD N-terminal domain